MNRRTYTAEELISCYVPSDVPPNFSSFGPVGSSRPDFRPLRMNNLYNVTNITNISNNKYDNDMQYVQIARASSEQTQNWEPHVPQKNPLSTFSSSNTINNMQKHQQNISPPDSSSPAFGTSSYQDFPYVLNQPNNDQVQLNEQQQQPQLHQQASSLPPTPQMPQQTQQQQQPPQYPFMYLPPTQFYPFVNSAQPFAVYSQYPQPPQFQPPGYGRPQPQYSQRFAYVNQPVMSQLMPTDLGIPPQPQPQLQPPSNGMTFNSQPINSQFQPQSTQQQEMEMDQFGQPPQSNSQTIPNGNEDSNPPNFGAPTFQDNEDPSMMMKYGYGNAFPSFVSPAGDDESFGSVLHPQQQTPQHSVDKPFNPAPISYPSNMNDIQQQQVQTQQQQSGSNNSLGFPNVIQEQDEFSPVLNPGFHGIDIQQNQQASFKSVISQQDENEPSFPSFVPSQPQQAAASSVSMNQNSVDSNSLDSGFPSFINNHDQGMQSSFPVIIDNQQPYSTQPMQNQSFNSIYPNNNSGFQSVVSPQQPQQVQPPQQMKNAPENIGATTFNPISIEAPQFQPQGFDNSGMSMMYEMTKQDEFFSVINPQPNQHQPQQQQTAKQQQQPVPQIEPAVSTFRPKKTFPVSSSVPPKDSFNPQPIVSRQPQSQPQGQQHPIMKTPTLQQPPQALQPPTLQQPPPTLQPPTLQQPPQLEKKPTIEAPTFQPRRIHDPLHCKSNGLIRSKSTPIRTPNEPSPLPNILSGVPQFQPQQQPQLQMPPPQLQQPQLQQPPQQQPNMPSILQPPILQNQPQIHDQVFNEKNLQEPNEVQKEVVPDSTTKKFQPKPFNAIEVEEKRPQSPSNDQIQQNLHQQQQQQQHLSQPPKPQRQQKKIRKRDLPGPPFDPKPIAQNFYYSPTPTPDINDTIKPRKDTFIGRRRVW